MRCLPCMHEYIAINMHVKLILPGRRNKFHVQRILNGWLRAKKIAIIHTQCCLLYETEMFVHLHLFFLLYFRFVSSTCFLFWTCQHFKLISVLFVIWHVSQLLLFSNYAVKLLLPLFALYSHCTALRCTVCWIFFLQFFFSFQLIFLRVYVCMYVKYWKFLSTLFSVSEHLEIQFIAHQSNVTILWLIQDTWSNTFPSCKFLRVKQKFCPDKIFHNIEVNQHFKS